MTVEMDEFVRSEGMIFSKGVGVNKIKFIRDFEYYWDKDVEACKTALSTQRKMLNGKDQCTGMVHSGLWELSRYGFDLTPYISKVKRGGKMKALVGALAKYGLDTRRGGRKHELSAQALADYFDPNLHIAYLNAKKYRKH